MNEEQLEFEVFNFIPNIIERKVEKKFNNLSDINLKGSSAEKGIIDFSDKFSSYPVISRQFFSDLSDKKISIIHEDFEYGFSEDEYRNFYKFCYQFLSLKKFKNKISFDYLKEKILLWIVDVHKQRQVKENLLKYLYRITDDDIIKQTFYYPILNIEIEKEFQIGDSKITFFSKNYLDSFYNNNLSSELERKDFDNSFRQFQGKVLVAINVQAEKKLAEILASKKAAYIIDILKLTCPTVAIPFEKCFLELESKIPFDYQYLSFKDNDISKFTYYVGANREHELNYTSEMIDSWSELFNSFGNLLEKPDEKSIILSNSISFFSKCISEEDLHLRVSKLIMIVESIFLKAGENFKMEIKSKRRFLDFRFDNDNKRKILFRKILDNMYEIRHKMTHKSIRLYIDNNELREFQQEIVHVLFLIYKRTSENFNKEEFIQSLDEKANA